MPGRDTQRGAQESARAGGEMAAARGAGGGGRGPRSRGRARGLGACQEAVPLAGCRRLAVELASRVGKF